ncbi:PAS domain S-box-containing protein [Actinorugispora endophytica]|uniref:protein-serine/threonine phosphatase n=1 Tax=Actinorugispora endophytica TaxID=1605990 RepID=A0A4R6UNK0_9ACTN|nr:PAS domain S-box-containing protein [Actinorugispora endophytica]
MAVPGENGHAPRTQPPVDPELARKVLDGLDVGVYVTDDGERIVAVNPRAEELLARPAADLIGRDAHDLLHRGEGGRSLPRAQCQLMRAFLGGRAAQGGNKWFTRGDGTLLPVLWLTTPYEITEGTTGSAVLFHENFRQAADESDPGDHVNALSDLADRLSLVSEVTTVLTSTLEVDEALRRLVWLVTPRLADWAVVDLLTEDDELQRVAVVQYRDGVHVSMAEFEGPMPPVTETSEKPLSRALRGASPRLLGPEDYEGPADSGIMVVQRELFRVSGIHSAAIAPLRTLGGTVLGALTLGRAGQTEKFATTELALVDDIARRAALAVDNAQLHERQRRVAETMQRHLLPQLPEAPGLDMAARYQAAPHASHVGGDWYDAFQLTSDTFALVIGDVVGHDLQAAARMSQIRNMLRAFAWDRLEPPSVIVGRLDRAMVNISEVPMATMVFARVEKTPVGPWQLHWTNAGHPPPLLVDHEGLTTFLEAGHSVLLGTETDLIRPDAIAALPPLSTLVLYTDGLVETPAQSLDEGLARLERHASALARRPLDDFCDELLRRARPDDNKDDIALIALRILHPDTAPHPPGPAPGPDGAPPVGVGEGNGRVLGCRSPPQVPVRRPPRAGGSTGHDPRTPRGRREDHPGLRPRPTRSMAFSLSVPPVVSACHSRGGTRPGARRSRPSKNRRISSRVRSTYGAEAPLITAVSRSRSATPGGGITCDTAR